MIEKEKVFGVLTCQAGGLKSHILEAVDMPAPLPSWPTHHSREDDSTGDSTRCFARTIPESFPGYTR